MTACRVAQDWDEEALPRIAAEMIMRTPPLNSRKAIVDGTPEEFDACGIKVRARENWSARQASATFAIRFFLAQVGLVKFLKKRAIFQLPTDMRPKPEKVTPEAAAAGVRPTTGGRASRASKEEVEKLLAQQKAEQKEK